MLPTADTKASLLPGSLQVVYTIKSKHNQLFAKETFISRELPLVRGHARLAGIGVTTQGVGAQEMLVLQAQGAFISCLSSCTG